MVLVIWLIGLGCLAVELFVTSIAAGVVGVICFLGSIVAMFLIPDGGILAGGGLSLVTLIAGGIILKIGAARLTHEHVLTTQEGYVGTDDLTKLIGQTGTTATTLRPGGFANIGGERVDVVTNGELIEAGTPVEVVAVEGNRVQVRVRADA
jgi:membrane-bound serine protease (ClpP class)